MVHAAPVLHPLPEPFANMPDRILSRNGNIFDYDIPDHTSETEAEMEIDTDGMPSLEGDDDHADEYPSACHPDFCS